jgi:hypothetical protein
VRSASVFALVILTFSIWVEAAFAQSYTLTLTVQQSGGAENYVAIYPGGDACLGDGSGKVCVRTYPAGTELTLSVNNLQTGWAFQPGWSGDCTVSPTQWWISTLTMDSDKAVTATFSRAQAVPTPAVGPFGLSALLAGLALAGSRLLRRRK